MSTISETTALPAHVRPAIKTRIQAHPDFEAFRQNQLMGMASRSIPNAGWIRAANALGLAAEVQAMLDAPPPAAETPSAAPHELALELDPEITPPMSYETPDAPAYSVETLLDAARPFVAPAILGDLERVLAPVVEAANKPPVEIVREVEVASAQGGERPAATRASAARAAIRAARRVASSTLGKAFGIAGKHARHGVDIWDAPDAPTPDRFFVFDPVLLAKISTSLARGETVWLSGPAGTGKTSIARELAAKTRRPFVRIAFQRAIEPVDLIGMKELDGAGGMVWVDGVLIQAMRRPGTVILLDELTFAPPGLQAILQTILDHRRYTLPTGELVECADGVAFIVADNTAGFGDVTGVYSGTQASNGALVDRMARMIAVDYLAPALEAEALRQHTGAALAACRRVVDFIAQVRKTQAQEGTATRPLSMRRMIAFVHAAQDGFSPADAWDMTALSRLPDADRETLRHAIRTQFDARAFLAEIGVEAEEEPSNDPTQEAARAAFSAAVF